jgi:hypothetical protein
MTTFRTRTNQGKLLCVTAAVAVVLYHHLSLLMVESGYLLAHVRRRGYDTSDCCGDDGEGSHRRPPGSTIRGTVLYIWRNQTDSEHNTTMMEEMTHEGDKEEDHFLQVSTTAQSFRLRGGGNGVDDKGDRTKSPESLFAPSIYGMVFPEELQGTSGGYDEDGTR